MRLKFNNSTCFCSCPVNFEFFYALFSEWGSMYEKSTYGNYRKCLIFSGWALTDSNRRPSACKPPKIKWLWVLVTGYCGVRQRVEFFVSLMECCGISIIDSVSFLKVFIEILGSGIFLLFGYLPFFVDRLPWIVAIIRRWKQMKGKDNQCLVYCVLIC